MMEEAPDGLEHVLKMDWYGDNLLFNSNMRRRSFL